MRNQKTQFPRSLIGPILGEGSESRQAASLGAKAITPEQMELSRVRAENARLLMGNEILKKAEGWLYLAVELDLFYREVVGFVSA